MDNDKALHVRWQVRGARLVEVHEPRLALRHVLIAPWWAPRAVQGELVKNVLEVRFSPELRCQSGKSIGPVPMAEGAVDPNHHEEELQRGGLALSALWAVAAWRPIVPLERTVNKDLGCWFMRNHDRQWQFDIVRWDPAKIRC